MASHTSKRLDTPHIIEEKIPGKELGYRSAVTIPVVVHVIWSQHEENIPDDQILSQIEVLNADFRANNVEIPGIPAMFQSLIADTEIEFCLATKDPSGNATTGITRTFTNNTVGIGGSSAIHYTSQGGRDAWDPQKYLNIWVARFSGGVGGVASFPGEGPPAEDGVEINYLQFGTINTEPPYNLGRTTTHEIGHYLNLEHPWGPDILDCCEDDFVDDTPPACETYQQQCPVHPVFSCSGADMFMNYMFYTDDACMGMFSKGQKARMMATLNSLRAGLLTSDGCMSVATEEAELEVAVVIYQNPVQWDLIFELKSEKSTAIWDFELVDVYGKRHFSKPVLANQQQKIPLEQLPNGIYFLLLSKEGQHVVRKIIKS